MSELDQLREQLAAVTAERDALQEKMPKWRKRGAAWMLGYSSDERKESLGGCIYYSDSSQKWLRWDGTPKAHPSRDSAMRAAESEFGLPICEVIHD